MANMSVTDLEKLIKGSKVSVKNASRIEGMKSNQTQSNKDLVSLTKSKKNSKTESKGYNFIDNLLKFGFEFDYLKEFIFMKDLDLFNEYDKRSFRFDFYIPDYKIGIEYEGIAVGKDGKSRHTSITGYTGDCIKYNMAQCYGYKVLRYTALNYENVGIDLKKMINCLSQNQILK